MDLNTMRQEISYDAGDFREQTQVIISKLMKRLMLEREGEIAKSLVLMGWTPPAGYVFPCLTDIWAD